MSKLAYMFVTLVGAVPAGFVNYLLVKHFLDRGLNHGSTIMQVLVWGTLALTFLVTISPFMVLFGYKEDRTALASGAATKGGKGATSAGEDSPKKKGDTDESFGDAIPEDFDESELNASHGSSGESISAEMSGDYSEDEAFDADGDFDYSEEEALYDFESEEEAPKPKKKGKK